ncbi:DMT family transporter [Microvirga massiliensis]|uniref:DMT family transporter n=1 Tax=Microvirga massiliensis TaxID=1033741 RepID=UPI00062B4452|nr:DMT family transporter [Microvirga massiliensis]
MRRGLTYAHLFLAVAALLWGANSVASKLAVGEVSPMVITTLRWVIACSILALIARPQLREDWPVLKPHWRSLALMGAVGITVFNALFFIAGHYTSAINLGIAQGWISVLVFVGAYVVYGSPLGRIQLFGILIALLGLVLVACQGEPSRLLHLEVNVGDLMMLVGCAASAGYTLALHARPKVSSIGFFTVMAFVAALTSLPLLAIELAVGVLQWPTRTGWLILVFIALGPSLLSQIFFVRGVAEIGPGRAGMFVNLVPVFGSIMAVVVIGERFAVHQVIALIMVAGGILIAECAVPDKGR